MIIITEKKTKERTKPKHHRIENYDILSNGFFFLRSSPSAVSVSPYTSNLAARCCFLFFSLCYLFRLRAHTHCAPWRLLLRLFAASTELKILMDFSRLPKKKSRKKQEKIFFVARWARSWFLWKTISGLVRVGDASPVNHDRRPKGESRAPCSALLSGP